MNETNSLAVSVGILAGISVLVTDLMGIATWLVFLAWLTFFFCGLGPRGLKLQLSSNLFGIAVGAVVLALITQVAGGVWLVAVAVVVAAFVIAQSGRFELLSESPGSFVGFAMIAAAVELTDTSILSASVSNPIVTAVVATLVGSAFAVVSEQLAKALTRSPEPNP